MTAPAMAIHNLTKRYGGLTAVEDVSMQVAAGEVHGVVGPNGAGKSTTLDMATGFVRPTTGHVEIDGVRISGLSPHAVARAGVGRTFQHTSVFGELSVRENLLVVTAAGPRAGRSGRQAVAERLDRVLSETALLGSADDRADSLPYGAQRRLEVAIALMHQPRVLLLDEPAAGMNSVESADFVTLLSNMHENRTIVIVEHDMSVIRAICDRTTVLMDGRVLVSGPTAEVLADPQVVEGYLGGEF